MCLLNIHLIEWIKIVMGIDSNNTYSQKQVLYCYEKTKKNFILLVNGNPNTCRTIKTIITEAGI